MWRLVRWSQEAEPHMLRRLLSLLLFGTLLLPQMVGTVTARCEGVVAQAHRTPVSDTGCRQHHPGTDSLPAGLQHCAASPGCASMPALPAAPADSHETVVIVTVLAAILPQPTSNSPEPQAPPPRV